MTSLARLAVDTGGRYTERTNNLSEGYIKAREDLKCVYTLGFYVEESETDRVRNVSIRMLRKGLRAVHPSKYIFRSPTAKRQSRLRAAWASPEMFQTGVVRAHVYPLRPASGDRWDGLLAVSFPVPLGETNGQPVHREFGAMLYRGSRIAHRFNRQITLQPNSAEVTSSPTVTFLEPVRLAPGQFTMTAVLSEAGGDAHAAKVTVAVPEIPRKELFLIGPVLGRPSGPNLVVTGGDSIEGDEIGDESSFEPLLVHQLDEPVDLVAFSQACLVGKKFKGRSPAIVRALYDEKGEKIGTLPDVALELDREELEDGKASKIGCQNLVDRIPTTSMPDGDYVFEASLLTASGGNAGEVEPERIRFSVGIGEAPGSQP